MIYLKKFSTHSEYDAYINGSGAILPNVSICTTEGDVHYNPLSPTPPTPSHDYVEIGGIKWATMNIGATSITDYGLFFQWADTQGYTASQVGSGEGQKLFGWGDLKYSDDVGSTFTKYNSTDGKMVLEPTDDAVQANWGGNWRMPTGAEFAALGNAIDYIDANGNTISVGVEDKRTTLSGVTGLYVAAKTDHSKRLFFPAAGDCYYGSVYSVGSMGGYWSSSLDSSKVQRSFGLSYGRSNVSWCNNYCTRYYGNTVRGVLAEN